MIVFWFVVMGFLIFVWGYVVPDLRGAKTEWHFIIQMSLAVGAIALYVFEITPLECGNLSHIPPSAPVVK